MGTKHRKTTLCLVYNSVMQSNLRLLLYMAIATIIFTSISGVVSPAICLLCIPLIVCAAKLSCFGILSAKGIKVYTFFAPPLFLPWDSITHYGTITKRIHFQNADYVYFSTKALITAPYGPMPKMCSSAVYFSNQERLRYALLQHWDSIKAHKLIPTRSTKKQSKKNMLQFYIAFYFVWLFRVLGALTADHIWLYFMFLPGIYISIGVIGMIYRGQGDGS